MAKSGREEKKYKLYQPIACVRTNSILRRNDSEKTMELKMKNPGVMMSRKKKVISECINTAHHITSVSEYNRHLSLVLISPLWKKAIVAIAVLLHSYNSFIL